MSEEPSQAEACIGTLTTKAMKKPHPLMFSSTVGKAFIKRAAIDKGGSFRKKSLAPSGRSFVLLWAKALVSYY